MPLDDTKSVADLAAEIKAHYSAKVDAVKAMAEDALGKARNGEAMTNTVKELADEALTGLSGMKEHLAALEQKMARGGGDETQDVRSLGEKFTLSDEFKSFSAAPRSNASASMDVKADITTTTTPGAGAVGAGIVTNRLPGVLPLAQRRMTVRGLLMPGQTDSPNIQYIREAGFTNNAGMVAEGVLKPQSDLELEDVNASTKVMAHWFRVSKQALSDVSQIRSLIDQRLLYGLALKEEGQLLYGDGTGENLLGIIPQATAYVAPITLGAETSIDKIRLMALQAILAEYPATGIVMHPADWAWVETLKDSSGRYIIGNPQGSISPTLWGLPVVATPAMTIDKVLVGAFDMGAQIFDQWAGRIETGFQNDDFTKNKVTILAEERLVLATYRPESFIYGDFGRLP